MANNQVQLIITALDNTGAAFSGIQRNLKGFSSQVLTASNALQSLVYAAPFVALASAIRKFTETGEQLLKMSKQTGIAVETLGGLSYAAEQSESSLEGLNTGMKFFSKALYGVNEDGKDTTQMLKLLGITAKDPYAALLQLADAFKDMEDGAGKSAIAQMLLGRSGRELIPLLNEGSESIRKMTEEGKRFSGWTEEGAKAADRFGDNIRTLSAELSGFAKKLLIGPLVNVLIDEFAKLQRLGATVAANLKVVGVTLDWLFTGRKGGFDGLKKEIAGVQADLDNVVSDINAKWYGAPEMQGPPKPKNAAPTLPDSAAADALATEKLAVFMARYRELQQLLDKEMAAEDALADHIRQLNMDEVEQAKWKASEKYAAMQQYRALTLEEAEALNAELAEIDRKAVEDTTKSWEESMAGLVEQFNNLSHAEQTDMIPLLEEMILKYAELGLTGSQAFRDMTDALIQHREQARQMPKVWSQLEDSLQSLGGKMGSALEEFFDYSSKGFGDWKALIMNILHEIYMEFVKVFIIKQLIGSWDSSSGSGSGILGAIGGLFSATGSGSSGIGAGSTAGFMDQFHGGGMVIPRFHFGGLRGNERLSINEVGERYITAEQNQWLTNLTSTLKQFVENGGKKTEEVSHHYYIQAVDSKSFADLVERNPGAVKKIIADDVRRNGTMRSVIKGAH